MCKNILRFFFILHATRLCYGRWQPRKLVTFKYKIIQYPLKVLQYIDANSPIDIYKYEKLFKTKRSLIGFVDLYTVSGQWIHPRSHRNVEMPFKIVLLEKMV